MGVTVWPGSLVALPDMGEIGNVVFAYDFKAILANIPSALVMIFVLFVGDFFATFSALTAVSVQTGWMDEDGNLPHIEKPFLVDAIGTTVGSMTGNTTITTFIESTIGVEAGGRTGVTALVTGVLFLLCIFLSPLFLMIPTCVTGVALIFVGFSMMSSFTAIDFSDFKNAFGPLVLIIFTTFTGDIAAGISLGILADVFIKVCTGKAKEIHAATWVITILFALTFFLTH